MPASLMRPVTVFVTCKNKRKNTQSTSWPILFHAEKGGGRQLEMNVLPNKTSTTKEN